MLATLLRPDAGSAKVLGHDVVTTADAVQRWSALPASSLRGRGSHRAREPDPDLRLLGLKRADAKARAVELLEAFGLADAAGLVKSYSGGMRRRLDVAASIVVTPELMFLDEPTTGLDPRSRNQVWDIVRALAAAGTTILLCTQYLEEADRLADGIAVIDHGRVIAEGTPGQLKASVGSGSLHVRLLDPTATGRRAHPRRRARHRPPRGRPRGAVRPLSGRRSRRRGGRRAGAVGRANRRVHARPAEPRRGVPGAHRPSG